MPALLGYARVSPTEQNADLLRVGRSSGYRVLWREGAVHGPRSAKNEPAADRQG